MFTKKAILKTGIVSILIFVLSAFSFFDLVPLDFNHPSGLAFADVVQQIFFQGRVKTKAGTTVTGSHSFVFKLYDVSTGGTSLWSETQTLTADASGIISCYLGSSTVFPSSLDFNSTYYLSINVDGDGEMSPRIKIVPSVASLNADRLDGLNSLQFLRSDTADTMEGTLTFSAVTTDIATGTGEHLALIPGGNVGIGTTSPGQKLSIAGTLGIIEGGTSPTYYNIIQGGDQSANITYTLPTAQGSASTYLTNDGSGNLSWATVSAGTIDHGALTGLSDDDHTQYALLLGRSGGQTLIGGTAASNNLTFQTTSNATKGSYVFSEMTTAGFLKNTAEGVVSGGNSLAAGDLPSAIDASKIADGSVSNTEFQYLDGVTSAIQTQLNNKATSSLTSGYIFVGNSSNLAAGVAMSGDVAITNAGVTAVGDDSHSHTSSTLPSGTSYLGSTIDLTSEVTGILPVANGGTAASTTAGARTNLGLGSIATQDANNVSITGGSVTGITDLAIADGGTGASSAAAARTNLGLGSIATQDANNVSISGGSITGITDLAVADGGTGTSTGSITATDALTFTAGGTNQNVTLVSSGTGKAVLKPGTDSTTAIQLQNAAGTSVLNVDTSSSYVGIGTTAPSYNLDVSGNIRATGTIYGNFASIPGGGGTATLDALTVTGNTNLATTTGSVGIGTTSPSQALELGADKWLSFEGATADNFETTIQVVDPTADRTITLPNETGTLITSTGVSGTQNYVAKFTGTSSLGDSVMYDDGTNVGIGTTSTLAKLTILGKATIADNTAANDSDGVLYLGKDDDATEGTPVNGSQYIMWDDDYAHGNKTGWIYASGGVSMTSLNVRSGNSITFGTTTPQTISYSATGGVAGTGAFTFSKEMITQSSSPAYLTFAQTGGDTLYSLEFNPDATPNQTLRLVKKATTPGASIIPLFEFDTAGSFSVFDSSGNKSTLISQGSQWQQDFENLVFNGSFESFSGGTSYTYTGMTSTQFASSIIDGWDIYAGGIVNRIYAPSFGATESALVKAGYAAVKVEDTSATARQGIQQEIKPFELRKIIGKQVTLSAYARKALSGSTTTSIGFEAADSAGNVISGTNRKDNISINGTSFTLLNYTYTVPVNTYRLFIRLYGADASDEANTCSGGIIYDGVTLVEGSLVAPFRASGLSDTGSQTLYGSLQISKSGQDADQTTYGVSAGGNLGVQGKLTVGQGIELNGGSITLGRGGAYGNIWAYPMGSYSGATAYKYTVTSVNSSGIESLPREVFVPNGPSSLSTSNYIMINWMYDPNAASYRIYGRSPASGFGRLASGLTTCSYSDTGSASPDVNYQPPTFYQSTWTPPGSLTMEGGLRVGTGSDPRSEIGAGSAVNFGNAFIVGNTQVAGDLYLGTGSFANATGNSDLYVTGNLEVDGTIYGSLSTGAAAPTDATYILKTTNANLTNAQVLANLATGLLKNTTTTGVLSIATEGQDYYKPGGTDIADADIVDSITRDTEWNSLAKINAATTDTDALANDLSNTNIFVGNISNKAAGVALGGDATISNTGALTITNSAVTSAKILDSTIANADISDTAAIAWAKISKTGAVASDVNALSTALTSGKILVGNVSNVATAVTMSGDVTIDNAGATTVADSITRDSEWNTVTKLETATGADLITEGEAIGDTTPAAGTFTNLLINKEGTATSGANYDSNDLILKGSYWDGAAAQDASITLFNDTTGNNTYKLSILDKTGTNEIASLSQAGALQIDGALTIGATALSETNLIDLTDSGSTELHTHTGLTPGVHATAHMTGDDKVYWNSLSKALNDATSVSTQITNDINTHAASTSTHGVTGALVGTTDTQTLTNKTLTDSTTYLQDETDNTKKLQFQLSGITTATTRTLTIPDVTGTVITSGNQSTVDHGSIGGLSDDDHSQYALLAGRAGGQTLIGGTAASNNLTFQTTSNVTKGSYIFSEMTSAGFLKNTAQGVVSGGNSLVDSDIPAAITRDTEWDAWDEHPALTSAYILVGSALDKASGVALSGDAAISNTGALTLANGAVTSAKILDSTIANADISDTAAIAWAKINKTGAVASDVGALGNSLTGTHILVGNASNVATDVAMSGDATLDNLGALTIANNAVTSAKIADNAIMNADINSEAAIAWTKISKTGAVASDVGALSTTLASTKILVGNVSNVATAVSMSGDGALDNAGALTIANNAITAAKLATDAVETAKIKDANVTSGKILDGTIANVDVSDTAAIAWAKINKTGAVASDVGALTNTLTSGKILVGNVSNVATAVTMSGDVTIDNAGATTVAASLTRDSEWDTLAKINTATTDTDALANDLSNTNIFVGNASNKAAGVALSGDATLANTGALTIATGAVTSAKILDSTIANADISDTAAIAWAKISKTGAVASDVGALGTSLTGTHILVGNVSNVATDVAMSGDATLSNAGALTIANNAITSAKIANDTIINEDINSAAAIAWAKISKTGAVASDVSAISSTLNSGKILVGNVSNVATAVTMSGDVTIDNAGATSVADSITRDTEWNSLVKINAATTDADALSDSLTSAYIFVGSVLNKASGVALSGDATINNTGALTIANSAITNAKVASDAAIAWTKISKSGAVASDVGALGTALTATHLFVGNVSGVATGVAMSGDATLSNAGALTIANNAITAAKLATDAVETAKIKDANVTSGKLASDAVTNSNVANAASIAWTKISKSGAAASDVGAISSTLTSGYILVGNATNVATGVTMGGDVTISNTGVTDIAANAVGANEIASSGVTLGSYTNANITVDADGRLTSATSGTTPVTDHGGLTGLLDDDHTQYALLAGRSGGQTLKGGTGAGESLTFQTTSNATKGSYIFSEMTTAGFLKNNVSGAVTGGNSIADADIPAAITRDSEWDTWAKHPALTSGNILVGNASNQPASVMMSGDATISNAGALTIANNAITDVKVASGAAIAWTKISKTGSSIADLATKSAGDLNSGNLDVARLPTGGNWTLSSNLNLDSNTLLIDQANDRVAIGAASAEAKLDAVYTLTGVTTNNVKIIQAYNSGATFNTTASGLTNYAGYLTNTATRSAGTNNLTNVALYLSASGAQNNYGLIVDSGYVGINATAPAYRLDVGGDIRATGTIYASASAYPVPTGPGGGGGTTNRLAKWTAANQLGNSGVSDASDAVAITIDSSEQVGIGTTGPVSRLDLNGGSIAMGPLNATGAINFRNDIAVGTAGSVGIGAIDALGNGNNDGLGLYVSDGLKILNGTTAYVTVLNTGNVGIGTTGPTATLHIQAPDGTQPLLKLKTPGNYQSSMLWIEDEDANAPSGAIATMDLSTGLGLFNILGGAYNDENTLKYGSTRGASRIGLHDNTINMYVSSLASGGGQVAGSTVTLYQTLGMSDSNFIIYTGSGTERVRVDSSGNVGIGETVPDQRLTIYKSGQSATKLLIESDQRSDYLTTGGELGVIHFSTDGSGTGRAVVGKIKSYASNGVYQLRMGTYNNEDVLNVYGGYVGIGTTGPTGIFSVGSGNQWYISNTNLNTLNTAGNANSVADGWINYRGYADGFTQARNFNIGDGKGTNIAWFDGTNRRMSINRGQAADYTLDVNGFAVTRSTVTGNLITVAGWSGNAGGYFDVYYDGAIKTHLSAGPASGDTYFLNTNVGIGTTGPGAKLHILSGDNSVAYFGPNSTWGAYLYVGSGTNKAAASTAQVISTNGNLHLDSGTGNDMYLNYYSSGRPIHVYGAMDSNSTITAPTFSGALSGNATTATTASNSNALGGQGLTSFPHGTDVSKSYRYDGDWNTMFNEGSTFFDNASGTNGSPDGFTHHHGIQMRHNNLSNNWGWQLMSSYHPSYEDVWHRSVNAGTWGAWKKILDSSNHGHDNTNPTFGSIYASNYYNTNTAYGFIGTNVYADTINTGSAGDPLELNYYRSGPVTTADMRADIFYDRSDTGYYVDPNSMSEMYKFTRNTLSRNSINSLQEYSPWLTRANSSPESGYTYRNGAMGWGTTDFNTMFSNWGGGIIDSWSNPANAPGGSSHYVGFQGMHANYQNGSQAYGFQMACAGEADNRFFWRSGWPNPRAWVEMIHSGNIGSQTVSNVTSLAGTWTGISYFQSNLGPTCGSLSSAPLEVYSTGNNSAFMSFHKSAVYAVNMGLDSDNVLRIGGWSAAADRWQLDMSGNETLAGSLTAAGGARLSGVYESGWGGWNYALELNAASHAMIHSTAMGGGFGFHSNGNFYWADTSAGTYAMTLSKTGNLSVAGVLSKGSGSFLIDHPLDPKNKVLRHSFVESPDMKNIYDGIATLNEKGEITVELPNYFEALNENFRYQITPVGKPALLYVKEEIKDNKFVIAGGEAGMKVSWQVTGVRKDAFAKKYPVVVEEEKGFGDTQKGVYLHPDSFPAQNTKS